MQPVIIASSSNVSKATAADGGVLSLPIERLAVIDPNTMIMTKLKMSCAKELFSLL